MTKLFLGMGMTARERLIDAAIDRFASDGVVNVTLEDVRASAGVSVGALYHHFADKGALLDAVYVDLMAQFQALFLAELRSTESAEDGIRAGVRCYLRWVSAHRAAASILLSHRSDSPALREQNREFFAEVLAWWRTHVHYEALRAMPFDLIQALWLGPAQEYTRHWLSGDTKRAPTSAAPVLSDAAWQVLREQR